MQTSKGIPFDIDMYRELVTWSLTHIQKPTSPPWENDSSMSAPRGALGDPVN